MPMSPLCRRQLECDLELARGEIEEREVLLSRAKMAIEALQGEVLAARRETDQMNEVRMVRQRQIVR